MNYDDIVENLIVSRVDVGGHKEDERKLEALKAVLKNIPTEKGKKYALSKFLNETPGYDYKELKASNPNLDEDYWSLKHQYDYTPPDIQKALEKANKENAENFWNWESDEHWSKQPVDQLKRRAKDTGYAEDPSNEDGEHPPVNFSSYLDKVREIQTMKDREKLYDEGALPGTKIIAPRATERFMRGEDWKAKDIGLDWLENSLYALNPGGRAAGLISQSTKVPKYLKWASKVGDVALNPTVMEAADAAAYDSGDRDKFNSADVLLGSLINAGMNKIAPSVLKKADLEPKAYTPVPKQFETRASEKARNAIKQQKAKATKESKDVVDAMLTAQRNGEDLSTYLTKLQELKSIYDQVNPKRVFRDRTAKDLLGAIREGATYDAIPFVSNKFGDAMSEDPRRTKQIVTRSVRGISLVPQFMSELVDAYYENKEKNLEQKKINEEINKLKKEK
jgi:hypothetical protein